MASATLRPAATVFDKEANSVKVAKSDINVLILDYLTAEGYAAAAERFSDEANLKPGEQLDSVRHRQQIQHEILCGNIQTAIEMMNDVNPEVLDTNPALHFALLRLHLIELIRNHYGSQEGSSEVTIPEIVDFASKQLAPRAVASPDYLRDLELAMTLLMCLPPGPEELEPNLAALLHPDLRKEVADKVNAALLASQGERRNAVIRQLVKLRSWAESTARAQSITLPSNMDLGLDNETIAGQSGDDDAMKF